MPIRVTITALSTVLVTLLAGSAHAGNRPRDFVDAKTVIPDLIVEIRYAGANNFMGRPIPGYRAARCLLTQDAAKGLQCAADALRPRGFALKVYDCYRPQTAVNAFVAWGRDLRDQKMKLEFYPEIDKRSLFNSGYIASRSGHSRGSTVDLTIVALSSSQASYDPGTSSFRACDSDAGVRTDDGSTDMGTGFDCFSRLSHTRSTGVNSLQQANRKLLHTSMRQCGWTNNRNEWWHYTLAGEPYPGTFFDFPVE
jgi:D-alanyl-D-alanine dipeptidase